MKEHKSLFLEMAEVIDRRLARRKTNADGPAPRPGHLRRFLRWLMPNGGTLLLVALLVATAQVWAKPMASPASAPGPSATTVNYQGRLANPDGTPVTDNNYGMTFALWDAATDSSVVWGPESHAAVPVADGLFSVGLGSQTSGGIPTSVWNGDRYLEIAVGGETLSPRELIRSVPIAGMALTVPDGSVESSDLNLDHGTVCLSDSVTVDSPGGWQKIAVPGLSLDFDLDKPSQVLVWIDGLARFLQSFDNEADIYLRVDDSYVTASFGYTKNIWFNVKGQRLLSLDSGSHTIEAVVHAANEGSMVIHGREAWRTCINYLVLGEQ